ncbi:hypothetical protein BASA81_010568 [Batrachochytrium salamandrivorans]|nr:hypothetical protein BASA81_010568 [Batrachochytrium salamandrivorans]
MNRPPVDLSLLAPNELQALESMRLLFKSESYPDQQDPNSWFQLEDWTYLRYLRARNYDVPKAELMLKNTLEMRRKYSPHLLSENDSVLRAQLDKKWWFLLPPSKHGNTVQLTEVGLFDSGQVDDEENFHRYLILGQELACKDMARNGWKNPKNVSIFDLRGFSLMKQISPKTMRLTKVLIETSDLHYPELLSRCIMFNAPLVFRGPYKIMRPWLSEETQQKIMFVSDTKVLDELLSVESRMDRHGGTRTKEYASIYYEEK